MEVIELPDAKYLQNKIFQKMIINIVPDWKDSAEFGDYIGNLTKVKPMDPDDLQRLAAINNVETSKVFRIVLSLSFVLLLKILASEQFRMQSHMKHFK